jgi:hypothetical protein
MRVTIIVEENRVNVEGFSQEVDCSTLYDADIHAVQWYGDHGEVEYWHPPGVTVGLKPPLKIDDFAPYQKFVDAWELEARKEIAA